MNHTTISASIIALGLVVSASVMAFTWRGNVNANQTVTVTGSATATFRSDTGVIRVTLSAQAPTAGEAFARLRARVPVLTAFLTEAGVPAASVEPQPMSAFAREEFGNSGMPTGRILYHQYAQRFEIQSGDVDQIRALSLSLASLVEKGLDVAVEPPEYFFSGLDAMRIAIQAEAAANATERAKALVEATGRDLGPLTGARMGVLQITPVLSNMVSDYGFNDQSSIEKKITGVVSATYRIL
jgi:hypothetical protein